MHVRYAHPGNAGLETADAAAPYANFVHVLPGRPRDSTEGEDQHDLVSWESRYVGNVRAINAGLFDAYLLKSLDGAAATPTASDIVLIQCGNLADKYCLFLKGSPMEDPKHGGMVRQTVNLGRYSTRDAWAMQIVQQLTDEGLVVTNELPQGNGRLFAWEHMWVGTSGDVTPDGVPVLKSGVLQSYSNAISIFADDLKASAPPVCACSLHSIL